jgi:AAA ATPase domain
MGLTLRLRLWWTREESIYKNPTLTVLPMAPVYRLIEKIRIQNFRSLQDLTLDLLPLNVFVGKNDQGKSNVLRALNRFFNVDYAQGYASAWDEDFSMLPKVGKRKARQIEITLWIRPPETFRSDKLVVWRKAWRRDEKQAIEDWHNEDRSAFGPRSKISAFLRSIRFDYVPAIRGTDYFGRLLSDVHDMLERTVEEQIRKGSSDFTGIINANVKELTKEIRARLDLETEIQLPQNLRELFARLDFRSKTPIGTMSLQQRGDGLKAQHIPLILKWLAHQSNKLSAPGKPKTVTVWGYEEPENSLELTRCLRLAEQFLDSSAEIQTFITTHSPAFYAIETNEASQKMRLFGVSKAPDGLSRIGVVKSDQIEILDNDLGLAPLLAPRVRELQQELERVSARIQQLPDHSKPTIFCEGPSDRDILSEAFALFHSDVAHKIAIRCSDHNGGGHGWVTDNLIAWAYSRPKAIAVGVYDGDLAGREAHKKCGEQLKNERAEKAKRIILKRPDHLKKAFEFGFKVPIAIEELFPEECWDAAEKTNWLEDRPGLIATYDFKKTDCSFDEHLEQNVTEPHLLRVIRKRVSASYKHQFCKYLKAQSTDTKQRFFAPLKPTIDEIVQVIQASGGRNE